MGKVVENVFPVPLLHVHPCPLAKLYYRVVKLIAKVNGNFVCQCQCCFGGVRLRTFFFWMVIKTFDSVFRSEEILGTRTTSWRHFCDLFRFCFLTPKSCWKHWKIAKIDVGFVSQNIKKKGICCLGVFTFFILPLVPSPQYISNLAKIFCCLIFAGTKTHKKRNTPKRVWTGVSREGTAQFFRFSYCILSFNCQYCRKLPLTRTCVFRLLFSTCVVVWQILCNVWYQNPVLDYFYDIRRGPELEKNACKFFGSNFIFGFTETIHETRHDFGPVGRKWGCDGISSL